MRRYAEALAMTAAITLAACGNDGSGAKLEERTCDGLRGVKTELDRPFDAEKVGEAGTELGHDIGPLSNPLTAEQEAATVAFAATMTASEQPTGETIEQARQAVEYALGMHC